VIDFSKAARCPICEAVYGGKEEHCAGGKHAPSCHLTFSSTRVGDAHLVEMDSDGWSRHLTDEEMAALRDKHGVPRFVLKHNRFGTPVWSRNEEKDHPHAPVASVEAVADDQRREMAEVGS
jgi:hypothetical protein